MLRIAVQSKGRLFDDTMNLLSEADIKVSATKRTLLVQSSNFPLEVLYLRDDDIPQSVASGVADIGVVGENEFVERGEDAEIISRLGFSKCRLSLAIPKEIDYKGVEWFDGKKIATSYPNILRQFLDKHGIHAEIHVITGSVEIAPAERKSFFTRKGKEVRTPDEVLERKERFCRLWNALNSLPPAQGRRVDACVILGKSFSEVALAEGVDESAVRRAVERGLENMKKFLKNSR